MTWREFWPTLLLCLAVLAVAVWCCRPVREQEYDDE